MLEAQWRLVNSSRQIILQASRQVLEDRTLAQSRYKGALDAQMLIEPSTSALGVFLASRSLWIQNCAPDDLVAIVDCAVRTARDTQAVVGKTDCSVHVLAWLDSSAGPACRNSTALKRLASVSALAKLKRALLDIENEPPGLSKEYSGLTDRLMGRAFALRADELLDQSYKACFKRAEKKLSTESKSPPPLVVSKTIKVRVAVTLAAFIIDRRARKRKIIN